MSYLDDHLDGRHQAAIVSIMERIDPILEGHSRAIGLLALVRMQAVILGPAPKAWRQDYVNLIHETLTDILDEMDAIQHTERKAKANEQD